MKQTTDELKKIIENAPEGFTHIDSDGDYIKEVDDGLIVYIHPDDGESFYSPSSLGLRSLSDIREIIELREGLEKAKDYLDSFIEMESKQDHRCQGCGQFDDNQINFDEAIKALEILKDDEDA